MLPPGEFVQPQQDPAAGRPELKQIRKQDCERNAAQRGSPTIALRYRPVLATSTAASLRAVLERGHPFSCANPTPTSVCTNSRSCALRAPPSLDERGGDSDDAVEGAWIEYAIERKGKRTYTNTFFTSLEVTADNVAAIARAGRARWKIENEGFNCLARHGYNLKRNFGHGSDGLANLLATLNRSAAGGPGLRLRLVAAFPARLLRETATEYLLPALDGRRETMLKQRPPPGLPLEAVSESP